MLYHLARGRMRTRMQSAHDLGQLFHVTARAQRPLFGGSIVTRLRFVDSFACPNRARVQATRNVKVLCGCCDWGLAQI